MYYYQHRPARFGAYCAIFRENFFVTNILRRAPRHRKDTIIGQGVTAIYLATRGPY
jgi:hypothetical protein